MTGLHRATLALCVLAVASACHGSGPTSVRMNPVLTTMSVSLSAPTISVGQATPAAASGKDRSGAAIAVDSVDWSTSASSVASVDSAGLVSGLAPGTATITATSGGVTASADVTVQDPAKAAGACKLPAEFSGVGLGFPRIADRLKSVGDVHLSVVFVDFPDAPATRTPQEVFSILSPGAENYYKAVSYGRLNLILDPTFVWRRMSKPSTDYGWSSLTYDEQRAYIQEAVDLAPDSAFAQADAVAIIANPDATAISNGPTFIGSPGSGYTAGGKTFLNAVTSGHDLLHWGNFWLNHEMGHMMGLVDLYAFSGPEHGYVGGFSIMGNIAGFAREYFGWERWLLGWVDDAQVSCMPEGTVEATLSPIERAGGTKIAVAPTGKTTAIVAESRRAEGYDTNGAWSPGVLVYSIDTSIQTGHGVIQVLPIDDNDQSKGTAPLQPGGSITSNGVTVTFLSSDSTGDWVRISR